MIRNRNIDLAWRNFFIPAKEFSSVGAASSAVTQGGDPTGVITLGTVPTLTALTLTEGTPNTYDGSSSTIAHGTTPTVAITKGTPDTVATTQTSFGGDVYQDINSLGIGGLKMNTDGRVAKTLWRPPADWDYGHPSYWRVWWTSGSSDTADTVLWKLFRKNISPNADTLSATVDTALDTVIATDTVPAALAYKLAVTAAGKWNALAFQSWDTQILSVEMDTKDTDMAEDLFFLGLEGLFIPLIGTRYVSGVPQRGTGRLPELPSGW